MKKWKVTIDGNTHEIAYKPGVLKRRKVVDGVSTPVKNTSWFIQLFDEPIELEGKTLHLTAIGSKVDLAVDDVYLNSKKPYVPLSSMPGWAHGFTIALIIIGWFLSGLFGILVGLFGGMFIIIKSISPKSRNPLAVCTAVLVLCIVIQALMFFIGIAAAL